MNPLVSVIIPNYNHAPYLRERIDSVLVQDFADYEVILLDDCSTDDSRAVIEGYRRHPRVSRIILNTENSGNTFLQWERGIAAARGTFVWMAESDDVADARFLSTLVPLLQADDSRVVAFCHSRMIDAQSRPMALTWHKKGSSGETKVYDGRCFNRRQMLTHCVIYNASMAVFRKSVFPRIPNDYQHYRYCGDWLFWTYVCEQGQVVEVCRQLNAFRQHDNKVSARSQKDGGKWRDTAGILTRFADIMALTSWQRRCVRGRWTKRFRKEDFPGKQHLLLQYPELFAGSRFDILCYELCK